MKSVKPFNQTAQTILQETNSYIPPLFSFTPPIGYKPWKKSNFRVSPNFGKSISTLESHFIELKIRETFPESQIIYSDGSVTQRGAGCSFIYKGKTFMYGLPPLTSSFSAEVWAIIYCLEFLCRKKPRKIVIATDNHSVLDSLQDIYPKNPLIQMLIVKLYTLEEKFKTEVSFIWIPSHRGIRGNEKADAAAKAACLIPKITDRVTVQDTISHFKNLISQKWEENWLSVNNNHLRRIKKDTRPWTNSYRKSRWEEVALTRIRIGHTHATHSFLLNNEEPPSCLGCGEHLTVLHILTECPALEAMRRSDLQLSEMIGEDESHIKQSLDLLKFIKFKI